MGAMGPRRLDDAAGYLYRTAMNVFRNRYRRAALAFGRPSPRPAR